MGVGESSKNVHLLISVTTNQTRSSSMGKTAESCTAALVHERVGQRQKGILNKAANRAANDEKVLQALSQLPLATPEALELAQEQLGQLPKELKKKLTPYDRAAYACVLSALVADASLTADACLASPGGGSSGGSSLPMPVPPPPIRVPRDEDVVVDDDDVVFVGDNVVDLITPPASPEPATPATPTTPEMIETMTVSEAVYALMNAVKLKAPYVRLARISDRVCGEKRETKKDMPADLRACASLLAKWQQKTNGAALSVKDAQFLENLCEWLQ